MPTNKSNQKTGLIGRPLVYIISGVGLIILIVIGAWYLTSLGDAESGASKVAEAPRDNTNKNVSGDPNVEYSKLVGKKNEERSKKAEESGDSFFSSVGENPNQEMSLNIDKPEEPTKNEDVDEKDEEDEKADNSEEENPQPPAQQQPPNNQLNMQREQEKKETDEDLQQAINEELEEVMNADATPESQTETYDLEEPKNQPNSNTNAQFQQASANNNQSQQGNLNTRNQTSQATSQNAQSTQNSVSSHNQDNKSGISIPTGTKEYAVNDIALNSDSPGPVMATVLSGPRKGGKYMGEFSRENHSLVIKFNRFVSKNGREVNIEAYAVDPNSQATSVASSVNTHTISRWSGLFLARFAQGYGEAMQRSGSTVSTTMGAGGANTLISNAGRDTGDKAVEALGKVGQSAGDQIEKNFDRDPTVKLDSNKTIGILITKGTRN